MTTVTDPSGTTVTVNFDTDSIVAAINDASAALSAKLDTLNNLLTTLNTTLLFGSITYTSFDPGSGYSSGTYTVSLTGGSGHGAEATIVVGNDGSVSSVTLTKDGKSYRVNDTLFVSIPNGSGFALHILEVSTQFEQNSKLVVDAIKNVAIVTEYWNQIGQGETEEATKGKINLPHSETLVRAPNIVDAHTSTLSKITV